MVTSTCEQIYKRRIAELEAQLRQRNERIATLEKQVAELVKANEALVKKNAELAEQVIKLTDKIAKLSKNSSNSSKPPSSDIVKPPRKIRNKSSRKKDAQPGHPKHERMPFSHEQINSFYEHTLSVCPDCGGVLKLVKKATLLFCLCKTSKRGSTG